MSSGREFQRTDAATGNECLPTVDRRNDGTGMNRSPFRFVTVPVAFSTAK